VSALLTVGFTRLAHAAMSFEEVVRGSGRFQKSLHEARTKFESVDSVRFSGKYADDSTPLTGTSRLSENKTAMNL
jgi:hypothetical protein